MGCRTKKRAQLMICCAHSRNRKFYFFIPETTDSDNMTQHDYFAEQGISNERGGGGSLAFDEEIMGWLFARQ